MFFFNIVVILSVASSAVFGATINVQSSSHKIRRGGTVGLFPFPRVGRAQPGRSWMLTPQDYADFHSEMKRQGLIPFPRVGRAMMDPQMTLEGGKRASNGDAGAGMWFGPRLGRVSKRDSGVKYDDALPWTMIALREVSPPRDFTPRLGRESEEQQMEEDQMEQAEAEQEPQRLKREAVQQ